jgi:hypothetical protein
LDLWHRVDARDRKAESVAALDTFCSLFAEPKFAAQQIFGRIGLLVETSPAAPGEVS